MKISKLFLRKSSPKLVVSSFGKSMNITFWCFHRAVIFFHETHQADKQRPRRFPPAHPRAFFQIKTQLDINHNLQDSHHETLTKTMVDLASRFHSTNIPITSPIPT